MKSGFFFLKYADFYVNTNRTEAFDPNNVRTLGIDFELSVRYVHDD